MPHSGLLPSVTSQPGSSGTGAIGGRNSIDTWFAMGDASAEWPPSLRRAGLGADGLLASGAMPKAPLLLAGLLLVAALGCDRNIEPFVPGEEAVEPDLSKIFPEGAEQTAEAPGAQAAGGAPPAPPPAAGGAAAQAPAGPGSDAPPLRGTIRLDESLQGRVRPGSILFLIVRTGPAGPPTAVKRVAEPSFPLDFEIGPDDRMIEAMPFQGPFTVTARIDADRNAMTRNPGDLQGQADGTYEPGAEGIDLLIDEAL